MPALSRLLRDTAPLDEADPVTGCFAHTLAQAAALGVEPSGVARTLSILKVAPTLTAHPTEIKRVNALEAHPRIFRLLFDLEARRWTPRERAALIDDIRAEIDLLWMTGDLRLERLSLQDDVRCGQHFFRDASAALGATAATASLLVADP